MPNKYDEYEIRNAIRQDENDRQLDQQSTELAGFIVSLLAPILIPLTIGLMALAFGVGIPAFLFILFYTIIWTLLPAWLAIISIVFTAVLFCALDIFCIWYFWRKFTGIIGGLTIGYLLVLMVVPWISAVASYAPVLEKLLGVQ